MAVATDITDPAAAEGLAAAALGRFGRVDTLISNALVEPPHTELVDTSLDDIRLGMEVDVYAALRLSGLFAPALRESRGSIVMVNSSVLRHSKRACGAYKMAKSALLSLAQSLATELGPEGIRVNSVAPGPMWTEKVKDFVEYGSRRRAACPLTRGTTRSPRGWICGGCRVRRRPPTR